MRRWITWLLSRARFEREMREELRAHLEHRADDLVGSGLPRDVALRQARIEFGAVESYKEQCRDASGFLPLRPFHGAWGDLRLATRRLIATPFFMIFAVVSLALGLSVTTAAYSLLDALFWKPPAFSDPARLAFVTTSGNGVIRWRARVSHPDFADLRTAGLGGGDLAAAARVGGSLSTPGFAEVIDVEAVTGNFFAVLGIEPALGRAIQPADERGAARVIVLGEDLWRRAFHADPRIVGRTVRLGGEAFEIVGVAPKAFGGLTLDPMLGAGAWVPLSAATGFGRMAETITNRERRVLSVVARLPAGRSTESFAAEVAAAGRALDRSSAVRAEHAGPDDRVAPRGWSAHAPRELQPGNPGRIGLLLAGLVGLVLVVACTNLANLMLARGAARRQEFAVRRALGASRWRLVRELSAESLLVAVLGGALAIPITAAALALATVDLPTARGIMTIEPQVSVRALALAGAALLLSLMVFGLEPALQLTRSRISPDLGGGASQGRQRSLLRWQVAICTCFFLIAAILGRVIAADLRHHPGIDLHRLALASVHFQTLGWDDARARKALEAALEDARREPAFESVAVSSGLPFGYTGTPLASVTTPDKPFVHGALGALVLHSTPEIFRTLGVPILRGRAFDDRDGPGAAPVAVVSERLARDLFGTADVVGRDLSLQLWQRPPARTFTIVGVSADTDIVHLSSRTGGLVYVPFAQERQPSLVLVARTGGDPAGAARLLQTVLRRVDPEFSTGTAGAASILLGGYLVAARIAGVLAAALGALTLLLSMVGLFGVQSEIVSRRTREVGVRVALGATAQQIRRMVLGQGFRPVIQGMALGLFFGVVCRFGLRAILGAPIAIVDPVAFTIIPVLLFAAAYLACLIPARRAASVDPNVALRHL